MEMLKDNYQNLMKEQKRVHAYQPIDLEKTGQRLQKMLKEAGYNVRFVQEYLHLACPQSIYRWFRGDALPTVEHLYALSDLLHVHMEDLLVLKRKDLSPLVYFEKLQSAEKRNGRLRVYVRMLPLM